MQRNVLLLIIAFVLSAVPALASSAPDAAIPDLSGMRGLPLGRVEPETVSARISYLESRSDDSARAELDRLRLVQRGELVVERILARLKSVDPSVRVSARQFTLTTDIRREFAGEPEGYIKAMENSYMFTLPGRSSQIFLNASTELFKRAADNDADWITLGATIVVHEHQHLDGNNWEDRSEHVAFKRQLEVLDRIGADAFRSKGFYNKMSKFVKKGAESGQ
jgi:hypothetical protein